MSTDYEGYSSNDSDSEETSSSEQLGPEDFEKLKSLGHGDTGRVYLVRRRGTDELFAMKVITKKDMIKRKKVDRVLTEREILATAEHPFIVTLHWSFQSEDKLYLVMEFCAGGEFFKMLKAQPEGRLEEDEIRFYAAEVIMALEYLHTIGFVYRDLKPENILVQSDGHIVLSDFDLSTADKLEQPRVVLSRSGTHKHLDTPLVVDSEHRLMKANSFVGTEEYIAPEIVQGTGHGSSVDWWTLGILIYEAYMAKTPFKGENQQETFKNIASGMKIKFTGRKASKDIKSLIRGLCRVDPLKRLGSNGGASEIKAHPFFKNVNWALIRNTKPPLVPKVTYKKESFEKSKKKAFPDKDDEGIDGEELGGSFKDFDFTSSKAARNSTPRLTKKQVRRLSVSN